MRGFEGTPDEVAGLRVFICVYRREEEAIKGPDRGVIDIVWKATGTFFSTGLNL